MRQVTGLTSTYSSDEFGICSALFELGGLIVMHDASGCNSTYTTHDEPRWYDTDSMIYVSAISEMEAIMGDDDKLIRDIVKTARELHPKFIAVVGAPIPYMIGTDLEAVARIAEHETGIPSFGFPANGMNLYTKGISMALRALTDRFCTADLCSGTSGSADRIPDAGGSAVEGNGCAGQAADGSGICTAGRESAPVMNIIGMTPLDFSLNGSAGAIWAWAERHGFRRGICMAMGSTLEEIAGAGEADVNLVVSYGGLEAARLLKERYGTPYLTGVPFGSCFAQRMGEMLRETAGLDPTLPGAPAESVEPAVPGGPAESGGPAGKRTARAADPALPAYSRVERAEEGGKKPVLIVGESVYSASLAAAAELELGIPAKVLCPVDTENELLREGDLRTPEEDDLIAQFRDAERIAADPLFRPLAPGGAKFSDLPHEAFSGRIYDRVNHCMIDRPLPAELMSWSGREGAEQC